MTILRRIGALARRHPATLAVTIVITATGVISLATGDRGPFTLEALGLDSGGIRAQHWWLVVTSLAPLGGVVQLVVTAAAGIVALGIAERLMGGWRTVLAFLVTGVVASVIGIGLQLLGQRVGEFWSASVHQLDTVDPLTPIAGALAWATAWAGPVTRRRLRIALLTIAASMLLYSGQPADLYLVVGVLVGIAIGARLRPAAPTRSSAREVRGLLALSAAVLAIGPVLTMLSGARYGLLSPLGTAVLGGAPAAGQCQVASHCIDMITHHRLTTPGGIVVALLPLVLQLIGARAIAVGRRAGALLVAALGILNGAAAAWYLGLAPIAGVPSSLGVKSGHEWEFTLWLLVSTLIPLGLAVAALALRRVLPVRAPRRRAIVAGVVAIAGVVVPGAAYVGVGLLRPWGFQPRPTPGGMLASLADRLTPAPLLRHEVPVLVAHGPIAQLAAQAVGPVVWISLVVAALIACSGRRPSRPAPHTGLAGQLAARSGTLGHMATWPGVQVWTAPDGGAVAYRLVDGCAITVSDPIGRAGHPARLLDGFLRFCDGHAWTPVFYSVHESWRALLAARGWSSVIVAEEAVVDVAGFGLAGRAMQDVRTSVNRAGRLGLSAHWSAGDRIPPRLLAQLEELSAEWLAGRDLPELGFTLGGIPELLDPEVEVGVALDADGRILAVTSWLPITEGGRLVGRTLDVMRRRGGAPNGTMEFLLADAIGRMAAQGLRTASLSGSPLAGSADVTRGILGRILNSLGGALEPVYGFRSLHRFKLKFGPRVEPLFLCVRDPLALPTVGLAVARAYLPGLGLREARTVLAAR